jgi:hypothetical protein
MTPTHLRKKSTTEWKYVKYVGMKSKTETHYFCGKAKNMTISTEHHTQVTCKKCLAKIKSNSKD